MEDLEHGDSPGTSTGCTIERISDQIEGYIDEIPSVRATKWTPYEASLATMEADLKTGIGRCIGESANPARANENNDPPAASESTDDGDPANNSTAAVRTKNMTEPLTPPATPIVNPNPLAAHEQRTKDFVSFALIFGNRSVSGSNIGDIAQTQEMLDFCGAHDITADIEVIPVQQVNEAWQRLEKGNVKYRFVIDMASLTDA